MITRYTTPPISLLVKGVDITSADVYVTIKQLETEINLEDSRLTLSYSNPDTTITFSLTQEESGSLNLMACDVNAYCDIQVNWISGGVRYATEIARAKIYDNLLDEVIE